MVAKLKLKGIDGRAPPGVEERTCSSASDEEACVASRRERRCLLCAIHTKCDAPRPLATPSHCWKLLKPLHTKARWKRHAGRWWNHVGYGDNCTDAASSLVKVDNQQQSPSRGGRFVAPPRMDGVHRLNGGGPSCDGLRYSRPLPRGSQHEDVEVIGGELAGHRVILGAARASRA